MRIKSLIEKPEHFVVHEIIDDKFTRNFTRTRKGIEKVKGKYFLYVMKKRNMTTHAALSMIAKNLGIKKESIGYAGLKDRFAVTTQYVTIKNTDKGPDLEELNLGNVQLFKVGNTDKQIEVGNLTGNHFVITLRKKHVRNLQNVKKINQKGFPNYFGEQRFGNKGNNHVIGKFLLKRKFKEALKLINENSKENLRNIQSVEKTELKFFIHAYQSWIFNAVLKECIRKKLPVKRLPVIGNSTVLGKNKADRILLEILEKDGVKSNDFKIHELRLTCNGAQRAAFVKTGIKFNILKKRGFLESRRSFASPKIIDDYFQLYFTLPKGSYATVVLAELIRGSS